MKRTALAIARQWKLYRMDLGPAPWHRWKVYLNDSRDYPVSGCFKMTLFRWTAVLWAKMRVPKFRTWKVLRVSLPMIITIALLGLTGCGTIDPGIIINALTNSIPVVTNDVPVVPPVVVEPDPEPDPPPPDPAGVTMNNGIENSIGWPITSEIENARIEGNRVVWDYKNNRQAEWKKAFGRMNSCMNVILTIDGKEVAFVTEWLWPGLDWQDRKEAFRSVRSNGKVCFEKPYRKLIIGPEHNPQVYVSGINWSVRSPNVRERSNAVKIRGL